MADVDAKTVSGGVYSGNVPDHVPPELVFDLQDLLTPADEVEPYAGFRNALPRIFYSPNIAPRNFTEGTWVVTRYEDIREVYQNSELYSTADVANFQTVVGETFRMLPIAADPPEHTRYRILLNPWVSPKALAGLEDQIAAAINKLIEGFADKGECDVAHDFGRLYPVQIFMSLMGFPPEDLEPFLEWEDAILHSRDMEKMRWGMRSAIAYLRAFIEKVRKNPDDTLTSKIVHGRMPDEDRPLSEDEVIGMVTFLWMGGLDTVASSTSLIFRRLALVPELQQQLRENPDLIPEAVEEFLRMQPLVNSVRLVKKEHVLHGQTIKVGDHVQCLNATGNFDEDEFEDPWVFKVDRAANRHLTFGGGPHRCMGSHLARRELRLAITEFLRRIPPFRIKPGAAVAAYPGLLAMRSLPIVWEV